MGGGQERATGVNTSPDRPLFPEPGLFSHLVSFDSSDSSSRGRGRSLSLSLPLTISLFLNLISNLLFAPHAKVVEFLHTKFVCETVCVCVQPGG